ncbi:MAG: hypothetical protein RBU29_09490 [bacterium]|nr:hypothetical protein [bacterium]
MRRETPPTPRPLVIERPTPVPPAPTEPQPTATVVPTQASEPTPASQPAQTHQEKAIEMLDEKPHAKIDGDEVEELSGVIRARQPGEYWGHNDRGNKPVLYRFSADGDLLQKIKLDKIENTDWEAITRDQQGYLYIGCFGDNDRQRSEYAILRLPEPNPGVEETTKVETMPFTYADGKAHNCEAFFYYNTSFYLITKENKKSDPPRVFRLDGFHKNRKAVASVVGDLGFTGVVTDAAIAVDGRWMAILTEKTLYLLPVQGESSFLGAPQREISLDLGQCEGLCFDGETLLISNEKGHLWHYPLPRLLMASD